MTVDMSSGSEVLDLHDIDPSSADAHRFGGKARGLARLLRAGVSVPPGFAVAASAEEPEDWPEDRRDAFLRHCRRLLERGPVAVRSSGLHEDSAKRSFAGLFETTLGVSCERSALDAAARCIASGGSERVIAYAGAAGALPVGIVVQSMVAARCAGVVFTQDPEGRGPGLRLEAIEGTAEDLVGGRETPSGWWVYQAGTGELEVHADQDGGVLSTEEVRALAAQAWQLAAMLGEELDLEFAVETSGAARWLQARPITTGRRWEPPLVVGSVPGADDGAVTVWTNSNAREAVPDPVTPLGWSLLRDTVGPLVSEFLLGFPRGSAAFEVSASFDLVDGRAYFNLNALYAGPVMGRRLPTLMKLIDRRAAETSADLIRRGVLTRRRLPGRWRLALIGPFANLLGALRRLRRWRRPDQALAMLDAASRSIGSRRPVTELSDRALVKEFDLLSEPANRPLEEGLGMAGATVSVWLLADRIFRARPAVRRVLAQGIEGNPTTAISIGIDRLVEAAATLAGRFEAADDPGQLLAALRAESEGSAEVAAWLGALDDFLARFGHRGPGEIDIGIPRWRDDPSMIVALVKAGLAVPDREPVEERLARLRASREQAVASALAEAPFWRRPLMRWVAGAVPRWMPLREAPKHHALIAFERVRRASLEIGRRLVEQGTLEEADEVFLFDVAELGPLLAGQCAADEVGERVRSRRRELQERRGRVAPDFVRSDGVPVAAEEVRGVDPDGGLHGAGIGGGSATGRVAVLREPDPSRLREGDVLVVRFADPAWTPLFPAAAAVVMEVGGTMCHAAVIAREVGIPAVFGVPAVTELLADGDRVHVDGDEGLVRRLSVEA